VTLSLLQAEIIGAIEVEGGVETACAAARYYELKYESFEEHLDGMTPAELQLLMNDREAYAAELRRVGDQFDLALAEAFDVPRSPLALVIARVRRSVEAEWAADDGDHDRAGALLVKTAAAERAAALVADIDEADADADAVTIVDSIAMFEQRGWRVLAASTRTHWSPKRSPRAAAPRKPELRTVPRHGRSRRCSSRRGPPARSRLDDEPEPPADPPAGGS
jgi:hypothetical protein